MEALFQDLRFAIRLLWKEKAFSAAAICTLALCIGTNAAIFSVVHSVVLRPLPAPEPDRILLMHNSYPKAGIERALTGVPDYYDRLRALTVFEEQALYQNQGVTVGEKGAVQQTRAMGVTPSFFRLLRARPFLGRIFIDDEAELGRERKVILSYALWQQLGGDPGIVGRDLRVYGNPYLIVGVMPRSFLFLDPEVRLWRPLAFTPQQRDARHSNSWEMIGRLKPGATREQAQAQIDALNATNLERFPALRPILLNAGFRTRVVGLQEEVVRDIKTTLLLLWGAVLLVMLIGAVNVANLVMARSGVRTRELATRFALGAGRSRIARQLITESVFLTLSAAAIGSLLGFWALHVIKNLGLERIPRGGEITMDATAFGFVVALALCVGIGIGAIPVVNATRADPSSVFHGEGRATTRGPAMRFWRKALVTAQVALALILILAAGILLASFREVLAIKPGFAAEGVLTGTVALPSARYRLDADQRSFVNRALEKIRSLPGALEAGATDSIPFGDNNNDSVILAEGHAMKPGESLVSPNQIVVTPRYFEAMRVKLLEGRLFDDRDKEGAQRVIVIDQQLARKFWPDGSPVGKRMWRPTSVENFVVPDKNVEWNTVIGVVGNVKHRALVDKDARYGAYYFPFAQHPDSGVTFAVHTSQDPTLLAASLRSVVTSLDAELPLFDVRTMQERIDDSLVSRQSPMLLSIAFGIMALLLAAIGIYGVLAYMVSQRTKEIGIRMALGSTAERIFSLILREGIAVIALGLLLGLAGAAGLSRYIQSILYGVGPLDSTVLVLVCGILAFVALLASILPARRAMQVDPAVALRLE